jgi:glycosyltransferase involved in cell wall biosynthesis
MRRQMAFHMVFTLYCEKRWKRFLHFLEAELYPYDPGVICVSSRLAREAARRRQRAWLLPPPVPQAYFRKSAEKPVSGAKVVTYIGRLGEGKGGEEIAAIMESLSHESDVALRVLAYAAGHDPIPLAIGERLRRLPRVRYERREHDGWSPVLEQELANELAGSDFLLLPYRRLSSSIDAPLLLLEGMASLCCVVTRPLGDIPRLYGNSPFLIEDEDVTMRTCELIRNATRVDIQAERARVAKQVAALECETSLVADRLLRILNGKEAPYDRP